VFRNVAQMSCLAVKADGRDVDHATQQRAGIMRVSIPAGSLAMNTTIAGHFDGRVIVPDQPVKLPVGAPLHIHVTLVTATNGRNKGSKPLKFTGVGQFDSGISDLGSNKKHLEGLGKKWRR
jgi:hypothetical protein